MFVVCFQYQRFDIAQVHEWTRYPVTSHSSIFDTTSLYKFPVQYMTQWRIQGVRGFDVLITRQSISLYAAAESSVQTKGERDKNVG